MFYHWHIPQLLFLELLKPTTEESQRGLTSALNCKEEQCDMFRMASFEGALKPFFICLKTLSHSEVSHSIRWCTGTQPPAVPWPPHSDIKPSLNLRISFQRKTSILFSKQGNGSPWWFSVLLLRPGFLGHGASIWMETVKVWIIVEHIQFFFLTFLHPLSSDLLTERQVGVGVQVTGASIVAISVTQLTARRYSAICATGGWRNNGC